MQSGNKSTKFGSAAKPAKSKDEQSSHSLEANEKVGPKDHKGKAPARIHSSKAAETKELTENAEQTRKAALEAKEENDGVLPHKDQTDTNVRSTRVARHRMNPKIFRDDYVTSMTSKNRHGNQEHQKKYKDNLTYLNVISD